MVRHILTIFFIVVIAFAMVGCAFEEDSTTSEGSDDGSSSIKNSKSKKKKTKKSQFNDDDMKNAVSISYSNNGCSMDEIFTYTLTKDGDNYNYELELNCQNDYVSGEADADMFENALKLVVDNHVAAWDGFDEVATDVLDGSGFSFRVNLSDGRTLYAHGSNAFPEGYHAVSNGLREMFADIIKQYEYDKHPKVIESKDIYRFYFETSPHFGTKIFRVSFEHRGDDEENTYISCKIYNDLMESDPDYINYQFYGVVPNPPLEEIQAIIDKYNLAGINGYYEYANGDYEEHFNIDVIYESDEKLAISGNVWFDNYEAVRDELSEFLWNYIEEHQNEFIEWN